MRHRRCISAILMSFVLFLQPVYAVPPEENQPENSQENNTENEKRQQEQISAPSAILMEASTGQIIYEKNPDEKLPPASVTKVMTLLLINSNVITFVTLAGGNFSSGFFSYMICPVDASIRIADGALICSCCLFSFSVLFSCEFSG